MSAEMVDFHGLPAVAWRSADGASALATLQGAHLVSWKTPDGEERLFLSGRSAFEPGRAIRGGIPVCFPQFADRGPLAQHGFARNLPWTFLGLDETAAGASASFGLVFSPGTRALWPHAFLVELVATVGGAGLDVQLRVLNDGQAPFEFTAALHTYLRVEDAASARLTGLRGVHYVNRGLSAVETETREAVTAARPIDRVYFAPPRETRLEDGGRVLRIAQRGFTDTVVWNPGAERASQMADMDPEGYRRMLCVEAAAIEPPVRLEPGAAWSGTQSIHAA